VSNSPLVVTTPPITNSRADAFETTANDERRANGVYYTPPSLARVLADWAIEHRPARILEPSFGNGVFLRAAADLLSKSGVSDPEQRLFGVDIDPKAQVRIKNSGLQLRENQLWTGDLLSLDVDDLGGPFEAIIGNPPYIRHHRLDEGLAERGRKSGRRLGIELNGRSDAWAYFCAHLTSFLSENGRLALVLPGSILHADYAEPLLSALRSGHGETQLIRIRRRVFTEVQERTVILLVDRTAADREGLVPRQLADTEQLRRSLKAQRHARAARQDPPAKPVLNSSAKPTRGGLRSSRLPWRLTRAEAQLYEQVRAHGLVHPLGNLATVRIGVVTGANKFFVRSAQDIDALGNSVESLPIVSRGAWLQQPHWRATDQRAVSDKPSRLLLLDAAEEYRGVIAAKLQEGEELGLHERHHCSKRKPWYALTDTKVPHLFLPYMGSLPPKLIVNDARATCTNSIHRVWKREEAKTTIRAIAAGSWSTLFALSAEIEGRSYGGGVLKLEPGGAAKTALPLGASAEFLDEIGNSVEEGGSETARHLVDQRLLIDGIGLNKKDVELLWSAASRLREQRRQ
jgi:adenine-specific DNA-methyltransferase